MTDYPPRHNARGYTWHREAHGGLARHGEDAGVSRYSDGRARRPDPRLQQDVVDPGATDSQAQVAQSRCYTCDARPPNPWGRRPVGPVLTPSGGFPGYPSQARQERSRSRA